MKILPDDTIAALATPPGEGAIAVIRLSGPRALEIADRVFRGRKALASARPFTVHYGSIVAPGGDEIDECLATVFRSPRSYTGEDVVELSCHGGLFVSRAVVEALLSSGARAAAPGEFTRRAFLNGRIDLSRAEAVASLIASRSERARRASLAQLRGRLAGAVGELREGMQSLCALLEIDLDFAEEGLSVITREEIRGKIEGLRSRLEEMAGSFRRGRMYRDGISVVITGPPNAGKSSLFNALLKESRAIVTPVPGTTRDFIEESVTLSGMLFTIRDTAGIRQSEDPVESAGIERALESGRGGDIVLVVTDAESEEGAADQVLGRLPLREGQHVIYVRNKIDLIPDKRAGIVRTASGGTACAHVDLSALTGEGVHLLSEEMVSVAGNDGLGSDESLCILSERHAESLSEGARLLSGALASLQSGMTNEFVAVDLREAVTALAVITGEVTSGDVLNSIFSRFCIGK